MVKFQDYIEKLDIRRSLLSAYGLLIFFLFLLSVTSYQAIHQASYHFNDLKSNNLKGSTLIYEVYRHFSGLRFNSITYLNADPTLRGSIKSEDARLITTITEEIQNFQPFADTLSEQELFNHLIFSYSQFLAARSQFLKEIDSHKPLRLEDSKESHLRTQGDQVESAFDNLIRFQEQESMEKEKDLFRILHYFKLAILLLVFSGLITSGLSSGFSINRSSAIFRTLAVSEQRLRLCMLAGRSGILDFDLLTSKFYLSGTIKEALELPTPIQLIDFDDFLKSIHTDDQALFRDTILAHRPVQRDGDLEFRILRPNGNPHWFTLRANLIHDRRGNPVRLLGVVADVTKHKLTEIESAENQRKKVEALSKMAILGEIAGGIGHEINNPLTFLSITTDAISTSITRVPPDVQSIESSLNKMNLAITRIGKIISGLRAFSRDGSQDPFSSFSVKSLLEETLSFTMQKIKQNSIHFSMDTFPPSLNIEGRQAEISQVLVNLISNALDAIETLSDKWLRITVTDLGRFVEISFIDSGPGIPEKIREKLFNQTYTTKPVGKGTGLGLGICKRIVDEHSGFIFIDDRCSNTRFVVRLPKNQSTAQSPTAA